MTGWLRFLVAGAFLVAPNVGQAQHGPADHVPPAPVARGRPDAGPEWEQGREGGRIPYVRGDHWYGHAAPNDPRFHLDHPFSHGRFTLAGPRHRFRVARVDLAAHRVWLAGGFSFEIAPWEWSITAPWCWDCPDEFVVYDDPDHPGWYLLYNIRFGEYAHVQYLGA
jgi:hypothetical protein